MPYILPVCRLMLLLYSLFAVSAACLAGEFHNALSLQGFTGLLNTPNAALTSEGKLYALYSDQKESGLRPQLSREDSYMFSIGLFGLLELAGRFTDGHYGDQTADIRDLSGNFKLQVPFVPRGGYWPLLAVGMEDFGGGSQFFRTFYGVASEELGPVRLSAGYGAGPDRMHGLFGGVEIKTFDWCYLLGEYDTTETNVGLRLVSPELLGSSLQLQLTVKRSLDHWEGSPEYGIGLQIPLGLDHNNLQPARLQLPETAGNEETASAAELPQAVTVTRNQPAIQLQSTAGQPLTDSQRRGLLRIRDYLTDEGFQYVRVGWSGRLLVIEYENGRYTSNELDGIGIVAGLAAAAAPAGFDSVRLVLLKKGIAMFQIDAPLSDLRVFMADAAGLENLRATLRATTDPAGDAGVEFVAATANPAWLRPSLVLYPELKTFIGTEYSSFDYLLSLRPDLYLPLWKGAVANARWDIPLSWSEGFDDNKPFRDARQSSQLDRLMIFQAAKLAPSLMANIGAGMILHDINGTLNELLWQSEDGSSRVRFRQAYAVANDSNEHYEVYLAAYRYGYAPLDLSLETTFGRFWSRDTGVNIELKRFFGDTAFSVYFKSVRSATDEHINAAGVQFSLPLTLRQEMRPAPLQVKGTDEWNYAQESEIATGGGPNRVGGAIAVNPQPAYNLASVFYNRDRLSEAYLKLHLLRLRDAYIRYGQIK